MIRKGKGRLVAGLPVGDCRESSTVCSSQSNTVHRAFPVFVVFSHKQSDEEKLRRHTRGTWKALRDCPSTFVYLQYVPHAACLINETSGSMH